MNSILKNIIKKYWTDKTSNSSNWNENQPSIGQCAITSIIVQELLGGEIAKIKTFDGLSHYFNIIDGVVQDLTKDQFEYDVDYINFRTVDKKYILSFKDTQRRYEILSNSFYNEINKTLPVNEIEHISIRDPNYVAGSAGKPEVKVFCQTNHRHQPIDDDILKSGQKVYMKWAGGPIVASSKLVSWHSGFFENGNINKLRELTVGTNLFSLNNYWTYVSQKVNGFYTVIHLGDEEWLEKLLYPRTKSYGSSWIYLDKMIKKIQWLSINHEPERKNDIGRNIPSSLRFFILKRDNFTCQYCGRKAPYVELHIDHIIPWSKVKEHKIENLAVSCKDCNLGKSNKEL